MENRGLSQEGLKYNKFVNLLEVDEDKFIKNIKENFDFKVTLFHLNQSLEKACNPELLNEDYGEILNILYARVVSLSQLSPESKGLMDDFLKNQEIKDAVTINGLTLEKARDFNKKLTDFFDDRLSLTILSLADNDSYPTQKENLIRIRERMERTQKDLDSPEFEEIIPDENAIARAKRRIKLIEDAREKFKQKQSDDSKES